MSFYLYLKILWESSAHNLHIYCTSQEMRSRKKAWDEEGPIDVTECAVLPLLVQPTLWVASQEIEAGIRNTNQSALVIKLRLNNCLFK